MLCYIYDGTFDGLLTSIFEAYYRRENPDKIIFKEDNQLDILTNKIYIQTDEIKATRVYDSIINKISKNTLKNVFYVFLSELEDAGSIIFNYLKLGWKIGENVDTFLSDDRVLEVSKVVQKVNREKHLMLGLLRFRKLEGEIYYAPFKPEFNTVGLIAGHFEKRFPKEKWIIHDVRRGICVIYNTNEWIIRDLDIDDKLILEKNEDFYEGLWKEYFNSIAIKNRINPKLQKRCMPMKYWEFLVEKNI